jgi:fructose-bisphosphate aldolase class I
MLLGELVKQLDALADDQRVMLKLSIPVESNLYGPLINHPKVIRLVALSGGYSTDEACEQLTKNNGMIASFSRGLLQDLRHGQSDEEFDSVLGGAIDQICRASIA